MVEYVLTWDLARNRSANLSFRILEEFNKRRDHVTSDHFFVHSLGDLL